MKPLNKISFYLGINFKNYYLYYVCTYYTFVSQLVIKMIEMQLVMQNIVTCIAKYRIILSTTFHSECAIAISSGGCSLSVSGDVWKM